MGYHDKTMGSTVFLVADNMGLTRRHGHRSSKNNRRWLRII